MANQFVGEIRAVGFNFAPQGWAVCNGQLLPINQNTALFSILGITYGGDGQTTFALPNLQGVVPVGFGQGPGLSNYPQGAGGGQAAVTLSASNLPAHTHQARGSSAKGNKTTPAGNSWAADAAGKTMDYQTAAPNGALQVDALGAAGSDLPHNNLQPYQVVLYIIALTGVFPSRA
jgi:microcystin-dependent protein